MIDPFSPEEFARCERVVDIWLDYRAKRIDWNEFLRRLEPIETGAHGSNHHNLSESDQSTKNVSQVTLTIGE